MFHLWFDFSREKINRHKCRISYLKQHEVTVLSKCKKDSFIIFSIVCDIIELRKKKINAMGEKAK